MSEEDSAQKVHRKVHKKFFYFTDIYVCDNFIFLFHFFAIWLTVKFNDFCIIKTLFQILHVFVLLYKDKLKVQHENATCLLSTNILHFYVAFFSRKVLATIFNLGYTWHLVKDFLYHQSTISDSSENV